MQCYIISYDLRKQRNYDDLYQEIKSFPTWAHITESTWAIVAEESAAEIRGNLRKVVDADDAIFVVRSGGEAAWRNVICKSEWLKKYL